MKVLKAIQTISIIIICIPLLIIELFLAVVVDLVEMLTS